MMILMNWQSWVALEADSGELIDINWNSEEATCT